MLPNKRVIVLDSIGTYVWRLCDGEHTIAQIIKGVQNQYKLNRKEAEASLFTFMQQLGKRNFIAFAMPKPQQQATGATETDLESLESPDSEKRGRRQQRKGIGSSAPEPQRFGLFGFLQNRKFREK